MKKLFAICLFLLVFLCTYSQTTFQKTYGGNIYDDGYSVQQTFDSGYIIAGVTDSWGTGRVSLIKTDANGDTLWIKTYAWIVDNNWGFSVQQTIDTGYIITGSIDNDGIGGEDVYLIKTDANGDTLWTKTYGGTGPDMGYSVQQTIDTGYIITGSTGSFGAGSCDIYLIKTDVNGDTLWTKTYGGTGPDTGYSVQQTIDTGYIITGSIDNDGIGGEDVYLIKTDANGDTLWTKTYGGTGPDMGYSVQQTFDSGYIITGVTDSWGTGRVYLIKTDANGDTLWSKAYSGANGGISYSVQQTIDTGYIITGFTNTPTQYHDVYLIKTDANGDTLWTKTYGGTGNDIGYSVQQTTDTGYIITGSTFSFDGISGGLRDIYLIKTDANGNSGCNEYSINTIVSSPTIVVNIPATIMGVGTGTIVTSLTTNTSNTTATVVDLCSYTGIQEDNNRLKDVLVYPNPFITSVTIEFYNSKNEKHTLTIYNHLEQLVYQTEENQPHGKQQLKWNAEGYADGVYFYRIQVGDEVANGKMVKVR